MQTPSRTVGTTTYRALPAAGAARIPAELRAYAEWVITAETPDAPGYGVGWIASTPPQRPGGYQLRGSGRFACYLGGPYGPDLTYVSQCRSSRQGVRIVAEAYRTWRGQQARPARPARRRRSAR
ncbi:MAG: hypothetical protein ACRDRJ_25725 [Streptosporangiaceae bacterium]